MGVRARAGIAAVAAGFALAAVATRADPVTMWVRYPPAAAALDPAAALGRQLFFDASLSASGKMACSTCHDPDHAYGPPNARPVQPGGARGDRFGTRAVPSLRYLHFTPMFTRHLAQPSPDGVEDEGPAGGFTRDGAAQSLHEQALLPLLNPDEMANPDLATLDATLRKAGYAAQFQRLFGADIFERPAAAVAQAAMALEAFQLQDPSFRPYTSKFDAAMSGNASFSAQELRGYRVFNDPQKGNCAKCHPDAPGPGGRPAQFTDHGFVAIGVPRNPQIGANQDPRYFDLGLCGPVRKDLANEGEFCGMFKTPSLRNTATRRVFFHNGRFRTLDEVLHFYAERDTDPGKWYPRTPAGGFEPDDLPARYRANLDRVDVPFTRRPGEKPLLGSAEIADLIAFLRTLDDGYSLESGGKARRSKGAPATARSGT
ncbi:MAG TPA: cytochrome c peroxidase [Burkholderiaceae bacterium]